MEPTPEGAAREHAVLTRIGVFVVALQSSWPTTWFNSFVLFIYTGCRLLRELDKAGVG